MLKLQFPELFHWCICIIRDGKICVTFCFYNTFSRYFEIADSIEMLDYDFHKNGMIGMICDWKNKKEFPIDQWILENILHYPKKQDTPY